MLRILMTALAITICMGTGFVLGVLAETWATQEMERIEYTPKVEVYPPTDLGCDTPELRLFLLTYVPRIEFYDKWSLENQVVGCAVSCSQFEEYLCDLETDSD